MKPWQIVAIAVIGYLAWKRFAPQMADARANATAATTQPIRMFQTFRAVPAGAAEVEGRSSATESEMRATKAAVEANGGTFRYLVLTP